MYFKNYKFNNPIVTKSQIKESKYSSPKKYDHTCRYGNVRLIYDEYNGVNCHETVSNYSIDESITDKYITVSKANMRLDIIANNEYGISNYWWVVAMANNIIDAFAEIPIGTVLRIPPVMNMYKGNSVLHK